LKRGIIQNLIQFIVWYATQNEIKLTTVRLVKFIYLADLYFARAHDGRILTNFPWAFVYYGPYCGEALDSIKDAAFNSIINMKSYESKFGRGDDYNIFSCDDSCVEENIEEKLPIEVISYLKSAIKRYGDDTPLLLDHIYFETEPMIDAKKGDLLNFSKAKALSPSKPIKLKKISNDKIALAKKHIKALGEKLAQSRLKLKRDKQKERELKDDLYYNALDIMDDGDLEIGLEGTAEIET
jgi:uncharacterized phage-associated protein